MKLIKITGLPALFRLAALLSMQLVASVAVMPQRPGEPPARDTVERLSRIDTNRAAELQVIRANKNAADRAAVLKQVGEDFKDLQLLHNKMMADAWSKPEPDYRSVGEMIGQIAKKATRLKANLALPRSSSDGETKESERDLSTPNEFKAELLSLDSNVMKFVTNPLFRTKTVIELKQANQALRDLDAVIERCRRLKKASVRLSRSSKSQL